MLGRDAFEGLPRWERWERLLDENLLAVVSRPGVSVSRESADLTQLKARQVASPEALFSAAAGKVILLYELQNPLSSSLVRAAIGKEGLTEDRGREGWLPSAVQAYIAMHELYRKSDNKD